jgi:hypothetical protein
MPLCIGDLVECGGQIVGIIDYWTGNGNALILTDRGELKQYRPELLEVVRNHDNVEYFQRLEEAKQRRDDLEIHGYSAQLAYDAVRCIWVLESKENLN